MILTVASFWEPDSLMGGATGGFIHPRSMAGGWELSGFCINRRMISLVYGILFSIVLERL